MFDIKKDLLETHEALLNVTFDEKTVKEAMQKAARAISRQINIPGFRKGRVPYARVVRYVGEAAVLKEASDALLEEQYPKIIEAAEVTPYGPGQLEDVQQNPLVFTIRIPMAPTATLGDYLSLRVDWEGAAVTEEEITAIADQIREENAVLEPRERPAEYGDEVHIDIVGTTGGDDDNADVDNVVVDEEDVEVVLSEETPFITAAFVEGLVGMSVDEEKTITVNFPEDFAEETFQGQEVAFAVTMKNVYARELPDFDDALASTVGSFETVEALKQDIYDRMLEAKVQQQQHEYQDQLIDALVEQSEVQYPPAMLEDTIEDMIKSTGQRIQRERNMPLEDALQLDGMTMAQLREMLKPQAETNITHSIVLSTFAEQEGIEISDDEVVMEYNSLFAAYGQEVPADMSLDVNSALGNSMRTNVLNRKTLERLEQIGRGLADAEEAPAEEADDVEDAVITAVEEVVAEVVSAVEATEAAETDAVEDDGDAVADASDIEDAAAVEDAADIEDAAVEDDGDAVADDDDAVEDDGDAVILTEETPAVEEEA